MKDTNNMSIVKLVLKFLLLFVLIYGLFTILWFNVHDHYAKFFRTGGQMLFSSFASKGIVYFLPYQPVNKKSLLDITVVMANREILMKNKNRKGYAPQLPSITISSQLAGYTVTVLVITLILATPIIKKRKIWALLWGIILVHVFIVLRVTIGLLFFFSDERLAVFTFSPFWQNVLNACYEAFVFNFWIIYIVPVIIWILVTFRRSDWQMLEKMLQIKGK